MDTKQKKPRTAQSGKAPATKAGTQTKKRRPSAAAAQKPQKAAAPKRSAKKSSPQPPKARRRMEAARRPAQASAAKSAALARPTPDVVYTPAKPFNRNRLLLRLTTVVAVVLALTFGISIFFKVENVQVSGCNKYTAWTVREASGIQEGDNLLTFGKAKASGKITAALPYVKSVRIGIKLPDTVNIEIVELDVAYAIQDAVDGWWLITSDGKVLEKVDSGLAGEYTRILGVQLDTPVPGSPVVALEPEIATDVTGESEDGEVITTPVTVRASDRLTAALSILQYLEAEELFDDIVSVDVSSLGNIELWYGQQYQVFLGDTSQLSYKIHLLNGAVNGKNGLKEYDSGILDISFTTSQGEVVIYEPFE